MCSPHVNGSGAFSRKCLTRACLSTLLALSSFARPQEASSSNPNGVDEYKISLSVGLVVLPVIVTDGKGRFVSDLRAENFRVYEEGLLQEIALFQPEDMPVTVGLVVDNSGSMGPKRPEVTAAALAFAQSSNPRDQMFVINFSQTVSMGLPKGVPFTSNLQQLHAALFKGPAGGKTALYDGMATALEHLRAGTAEKKVLILASDGGDNASRLGLRDLLKMAEGSNAVIYTIGIFDENYSDQNPGVLRRLAKVTGGRAYFPESVSGVGDVCRQISRDIRQQYTIGYIPHNPAAPGKYHRIRVTAKAAGEGKLYVRTRDGYLGPSEIQRATGLRLNESGP